ncbi:MAG TPA: LuxR family transcriptional regulator, partial [Streptosporangiaceae bacterium]|nr:LuxR family transcriptional regulator [Streptosporangiaceae bacterium]
AFTAADIEFLGHIAGPVTAALRHGLARTFIPATGSDQLPAGPVVLLLSPALEVRAQTPQTQRYLQVLVPPEAEDQAPVPAGAYNVAAQLLAAEAGVDDNPPVARVHLAGGRWLTLRAARMDTNPTIPAAAGGDVAVSIEPSTAGDRVTVFARACGLTPREAELLQHLAGAPCSPGRSARDRVFGVYAIQLCAKSPVIKIGQRLRLRIFPICPI